MKISIDVHRDDAPNVNLVNAVTFDPEKTVALLVKGGTDLVDALLQSKILQEHCDGMLILPIRDPADVAAMNEAEMNKAGWYRRLTE